MYAVWELTLACNLACRTCGSRAGRARERELSTDEALRVVDQLAAKGVEEATLIGGESYLRPDWDTILRALTDRGIRASITTGGRGLTADRAVRAKMAGVTTVSVSIDGLETAHDLQRGVRGSFRSALQALDHLKEAGIRIAANTQVNRLSFADLEPLCDLLIETGIEAWQVQLTAPLGRAADHPELLLQPWEILEVVPKIAELRERCAERGVSLQPGNSVGYYGPYETRLRAGAGPTHWQGCGAGCGTMGIESDGTLKGCPSLPTKDYAIGNLREKPLEVLWKSEAVARREKLWGFCKTCYYADVCKAGCTFTAHALLGRPGNMPWCWHRADELRRRGIRERLVRVQPAPGLPFDHGRFELVEEPYIEGLPLEKIQDELLRDGTLPLLPAPRFPLGT
jgi:radical SAM protein with 4Fe4S-binding SPASM domain